MARMTEEVKARLNQHRIDLRNEGLCFCGVAVEINRKHCWDHLAYYRRYHRARRKEARRKGYCTVCCIRSIHPGKVSCIQCLDRNREWHKQQKGQNK